MSVQLIKGTFAVQDAIAIITEMIHVKIRFHDAQITKSSSEEDIKYREGRIKSLQKDLYEIRKKIEAAGPRVSLHSTIEIA